MKRVSLLKKILLGSGVLASVAPIALTATSCGVSSIKVDFIDFKSIFENGDYKSVKTSSEPFRKMLYGSKKIYSGNYILFVGSNTYNDACEFFGGNSKIRGRDQWFVNFDEEHPEGVFNLSPFYYGIQKAGVDPIKNFGIYNAIDFWDGKVYDKKNHEIYISEKDDILLDVISPWRKWTDGIITKTKNYNLNNRPDGKYEWDEKSVTTKEYIRNDESAKALRALCQEGLTIFPTNDKRKTSFDVSDNNTNSRIVVFKEGKLQEISAIPTTKDAWADIIKKYFPEKEEPKPSK